MDTKFLVKLTSRAWAPTILTLMHAGTAGRQAPLLAASGASRTAFAQSLKHLMSLGLLERTPGHGHPLRPEYRLTDDGAHAACVISQIELIVQKGQRDILRRSWSIPILAVLSKPRYFNDIKRQLTPITDRALSQSLKVLEEVAWVDRTVDHTSRPPRSQYQAVGTGHMISLAIDLNREPN